MGIQNFPAALQPIIQQNFLEREFMEAIHSELSYRDVADREEFPNKIGETITKTRRGLKAPNTTPLVPSANTNFDNGLTPSGWGVEQFVLSMNSYGDTIDLNTVTDKVGIVGQFLQNAKVNGIQAAQSLDRLARAALFSPYFGGNTRVRVTLGSANVALQVDDVRGFLVAPVNGTMQAISAGNSLTVTVGANPYVLVGAVADGTLAAAQAAAVATGLAIPTGITFSGTGTNLSTAPGGFSGVLTFSSAVAVADGTAGNTVQAANASVIARPSGRSNTALLQASDTLTMSVLLDGVADLRKNNVPHIDGAYNCYLDPVSSRQLFADPDFKQLYQGATGASQVFRRAW